LIFKSSFCVLERPAALAITYLARFGNVKCYGPPKVECTSDEENIWS